MADTVEVGPATMSFARMGTSAVWTGTSAYVFGGVYLNPANVWVTTGDVVEFAGNTAKTVRTDMGDRYATSAVWTGEHAFIFGGMNNGCVCQVGDIWRYDPATNGLDRMGAAIPSGRADTSAVWDPRDDPASGCPGGCAYVFGGRSYGHQDRDEILRYNPATDTLQVMDARLPEPRSWTSAVWDGRFAYVLGGGTNAGLSKDILRYDPSSDTLVKHGFTLPQPLGSASAVMDGRVAYVFGGMTSLGGGFTDRIVRIDVAGGLASHLRGTLPSARHLTSAVAAESVSYVFGGYNGQVALDEILRFTPPGVTVRLDGMFQGGWFRGPVLATLVPSGPVDRTEASLDGGPWVATSTVLVTGDGVHTLRARAVVGGVVIETDPVTIPIDDRAPSGTVTADGVRGKEGWWTSPVRLTFRGTDPQPGSGFARTTVTLANEAPFEAQELLLDRDGTHVLVTQAHDAVGNVDAAHLHSVPIDQRPPEVQLFTPAPGKLYVGGLALDGADWMGHVEGSSPEPDAESWVVGDVDVHAPAMDHGSGLAEVRFYVDGILRSSGFSGLWTWATSAEAPGVHLLVVEAEDVAGLTSEAARWVRVIPLGAGGTWSAVPGLLPVAVPEGAGWTGDLIAPPPGMLPSSVVVDEPGERRFCIPDPPLCAGVEGPPLRAEVPLLLPAASASLDLRVRTPLGPWASGPGVAGIALPAVSPEHIVQLQGAAGVSWGDDVILERDIVFPQPRS